MMLKRLSYWLIPIHFILIFTTSACHHPNLSDVNSTTKEALRLFESGVEYEQQQDIRKALIHYWDALELLESPQDSIHKANICVRLGDLLFNYGLYEKAAEHHRISYSLLQNLENRLPELVAVTHRLSIDYALLNQPDTAGYFQELTNTLIRTNPDIRTTPLNENERLQVCAKALSDSVSTVYEREKLLSLEFRYKQEKERLKSIKAYNEKLIFGIVFLCTILMLLMISFILYRRKKREEKLRLQQFAWYNTLVEANNEKTAEYQRELFISTQQIAHLQDRINTAESLAIEQQQEVAKELNYYLLQQEELKIKEKELRIRNERLLSEDSMKAVILINRMKQKPTYNPVKTAADWQILAEFLDVLYDGFSTQLNKVDELTAHDRELFMLEKLGFTTGQIAIFWGISPGSVTKAKFRIRQKSATYENANVRITPKQKQA